MKPNTKTLQIKKWGINGEGIGYINRKPVFIDGVIPSEIAEVEIQESKPGYMKGKMLKVVKPSSRRKNPTCENFESCGGCVLMHTVYKEQAKMKEQVLKEALKKYAGYTGPVEPIIKNPNPLAYRNSLKLPFGMENGKLITGLYAAGGNRFIPIERCLIHQKGLEKAKREIIEVLNDFHIQAFGKEHRNGFITLVLREFDEKIQACFMTGNYEFSQDLIDALMKVEGMDSLWQSIKYKDDLKREIFGRKMIHLAGNEELMFEMDGIRFKLSPRSFFQLNTAQALTMYQKVVNLIPESSTLVEAYAGIGAISLLAHKKAKEIIGIESIPEAVENANQNAKENGIENVHFICGDSGEKLLDLEKEMKIDTLVVDPPRTGLDQTMIEAIKKSHVKILIYVSCNQATLAKNIKDLENFYEIKQVQPIDLFSQTPHVETVCLLSRKK